MNTKTGEVRTFNKFDEFQEAMKTGNWVRVGRKPKASCSKCYGRGHVGRNVDTGKYMPCSCVRVVK